MDARVQDYLDDKFQSSADLETLDSLLDNVKSQQDLLKKQLEDARRDHVGARKHVEQHTSSIRQKGEAFQKEQGDIDRRLLIVTQSETSDDAVQKFEASMERLRKLDVAAAYVELLREVDGLRTQCISNLGTSDEAALTPYKRLQQLVASLGPLQEAAEGAAPHLLDHIARQAHDLRQTIQKSFSEDLEKTLKKMNWPKITETVPLALEQEWSTNVKRLLELQRQDLENRELNVANLPPAEEPPALLPLEVMMHPLEQRFTYHFSGNKPTNRLDKPEYFLSHITDLISTYSDFLQTALQPLLLQHFRGSNLAMTPAYIDAVSAFITALMPMLKRKMSSFAYQISSQPQLLSHLMHEVVSFDTTLQETYAYTPATPSISWRGMAYFLLETSGYFETWLGVERDFALARYQSIIDSPEAGELDHDSVPSDTTKPTKAAIRVNDLLETITDRYRPLASFSEKLRFLIDIQIAIFDLFHTRLHSSLEAYLSMTSSLARTVHGVTREDQADLQGVKGLDRLCRVFGSATFLERALADWSDDVFFLELWEELQLRAHSRDHETISRNLGALSQIQEKTSAAVGGPSPSSDADADVSAVQGALFDETAGAYARLRARCEGIIAETLTYNVREALRPYVRVNTWASLSLSSSSSDSGSASVSAELDPVLSLLAQYFEFLSRAVGRAPLRRLARLVCGAVQGVVWENLVVRQSFSTAGARQLGVDVGALCGGLDRWVGAGQGRAGMRRLVEGVALLSLPARGEGGRKGGDRGADDEGAAWEEWGGDGGEGEGEGGGGAAMDLFEAEQLVFMDNEGARQALERLGLETLSESDARAVLEKRVELSS